MREILFRGKRKDNGEWVEGYIFQVFNEGFYIISDRLRSILVIPETVGQYTGFTDKNGKKIFEGDIVHCWGGNEAFGYWEYNKKIVTEMTDYMAMMTLGESDFIEVIGNIHDNPELLNN